MTKRQKKRKSPANKTAKCLLHKRYMNDVYIHRRGCAVWQCKHLCWILKGAEIKSGKHHEP